MSKKDINYVAAVEKSIAEKYGKETVQDFRSGWSPEKEKDYIKDLSTRSKKKTNKKISQEEFTINEVKIKRRSVGQKLERICPVCKTYSFSGQDDLYMNRFKCCYECYVDFVAHEEQRWLDGWRPDSERLEYAYRRRKNGNSTRNS
jgi:hypothetical protein